jgi:hypothetical protein
MHPPKNSIKISQYVENKTIFETLFYNCLTTLFETNRIGEKNWRFNGLFDGFMTKKSNSQVSRSRPHTEPERRKED